MMLPPMPRGRLGSRSSRLACASPTILTEYSKARDRDLPDAIFMVADSLTTLNRKRMFDYAGAHHIPALYEYDVPNVHDGGLMSYGPDLKESMERGRSHRAHLGWRAAG